MALEQQQQQQLGDDKQCMGIRELLKKLLLSCRNSSVAQLVCCCMHPWHSMCDFARYNCYTQLDEAKPQVLLLLLPLPPRRPQKLPLEISTPRGAGRCKLCCLQCANSPHYGILHRPEGYSLSPSYGVAASSLQHQHDIAYRWHDVQQTAVPAVSCSRHSSHEYHSMLMPLRQSCTIYE